MITKNAEPQLVGATGRSPASKRSVAGDLPVAPTTAWMAEDLAKGQKGALGCLTATLGYRAGLDDVVLDIPGGVIL